jgi:ketosteroid isomerase-like protein
MAAASELEQTSISAWAHKAGILELGSPVPPTDTCEASDRTAFCERIARYCWAYDERRTDRLADCFTPDAVWEGSVLGQISIGPFDGREAIVDWLGKFWPHQKDQRRHMLLNTIVEEQTGDTAITLSYLLLMASTGETMSMESMGFYRTSYRRQGSTWRISRLTAGFDKPFWPGKLDAMSMSGRARHGVFERA